MQSSGRMQKAMSPCRRWSVAPETRSSGGAKVYSFVYSKITNQLVIAGQKDRETFRLSPGFSPAARPDFIMRFMAWSYLRFAVTARALARLGTQLSRERVGG